MADMDTYTELRQLLHRTPERSGQEAGTAATILNYLEATHPQQLITGLGGHGIVAIYSGRTEGPRVLVRCELDALPIPETTDLSYRSASDGVSHKCGHDGHMTILVGLAARLKAQPPERGSVILLYQPAEETGEGAARVLDDPGFEAAKPDKVVALHNLPGFPLGQVVLRDAVFASASSGMRICLHGQTSHAAEPEAGTSPALAVAQLVQIFSAAPQFYTALHEAAKVTVIHARVGEIAFGTSPGEGHVMVTLRSHAQDVLDRLMSKITELARGVAATHNLEATIESVEPFPSTVNDPTVVKVIEDSAKTLGMATHRPDQPFAWSEDFGHFTAKYPGALFGLGAGEAHPALHHPDYDFPDTLLAPAVELLDTIVRRLQGEDDV